MSDDEFAARMSSPKRSLVRMPVSLTTILLCYKDLSFKMQMQTVFNTRAPNAVAGAFGLNDTNYIERDVSA